MIYLNEETHTYTDIKGNEYLSVSKFISLFQKKFDRENISKAYAAKNGISQNSVLADWDKKRDDAIDHGNRIHNAIEQYFKTTTINPENEDLKPTILSIAKDYSKYYRIFPEEIISNSDFFIAGKTDNRFQLTSSPKSIISFSDFKTNLRNGIQTENKYNQYLLGPLSHLQDCNFNKYAIQLSLYAYLYQLKTNCRIGDLHILYIPPSNFLQYSKIYIPYLKLECIAMIEWYKQNVLDKNLNLFQ